jgi:cytochrome c-type biogenesis protein CcmH/NrfG
LQAQLGSTLALSGNLEAALRAYRRGVELAPSQAEPWRLLAGFCVLHEYLLREEGLPAARRAAALDPGDPANPDMLGQVLLLLEDFSTAQRFFETAVDLDPGYALARVHLGLVYALQGDTQRAYRAWKAVSAAAPGTPAAEQAERLIKNYFP